MNLYIIIGAMGLFGMAMWFSYDYGRDSERLKQVEAIEKYRSHETDLIEKLEAAKAKREVITNERIKIIKETVDECINRPIPQPLLDSLRNDNSR